MFALEAAVVTRLDDQLAGLDQAWAVFGESTDGNRPASGPTCTVRLVQADLADRKTGAVNVMPGWAVLLVVRKSEDAAAALDEAFGAVVQALHNWPPGKAASRQWNRMALSQIIPPPLADDGLIGIELVFETHARYDGQQL